MHAMGAEGPGYASAPHTTKNGLSSLKERSEKNSAQSPLISIHSSLYFCISESFRILHIYFVLYGIVGVLYFVFLKLQNKRLMGVHCTYVCVHVHANTHIPLVSPLILSSPKGFSTSCHLLE